MNSTRYEAPKPASLDLAKHHHSVGDWLATQPGLVAELAREELADITRLTEAINALAKRIGERVREVAATLLVMPGCGELTAAKLIGETAGVTRFKSEAAFARMGEVKAVTCTNAKLEVVDCGNPMPAKGQLLVDVLRCGICGSDLHARHHCDELADVMAEIGYDAFMRSDQKVVFGHEFCGEVVDHGPGTRKTPRTGTPVVALPLLRRGKEVHAIGLSTSAPGAYAEQIVVEQSLALPVPNGLAPDVAALTEPMAVGWHAVRRGEVGKGDVAIVIGCGPIGLAVICMLKAHGVRTVIASDFSAGRRALATAMRRGRRRRPRAGLALRGGRRPRAPRVAG